MNLQKDTIAFDLLYDLNDQEWSGVYKALEIIYSKFPNVDIYKSILRSGPQISIGIKNIEHTRGHPLFVITRSKKNRLSSIKLRSDAKEERVLLAKLLETDWETLNDTYFSFIDINNDSSSFHSLVDRLFNLNLDFIASRTNGNKHLPEDYNERVIQEITAEDSYPEGKESYRIHRSKERSTEAVRIAKEKGLLQDEKLKCCVCNFSFIDNYGPLGSGFIEAHHTLPVSSMKDGHKTKPEELVLVCSNCHRMLHRHRPLISAKDLHGIMTSLKQEG